MKKEIYTIIAALMCGACADKATYDACGTFEAEEILVSSQGTGQLVWFDVREGAQVEPGVVLGVVDTIQLHWQKVQLEAQTEAIRSARPDIRSQLSAIESQIATLKSEKQRIEKLVAKNAVPTKQLDDLNAQLQVLERQRVAQQTALSGNTSAADYNAEAIMKMFPGVFYLICLSLDFFFLLTDMEAYHQFLIFWASWIQFFI